MPDLTASEIMSLCPADAALLFPGDAAMIAQRYRRLAFLWHPDRNSAPDAATVFAHIAALHTAALRALAGPAEPETRFRTIDGRIFRLAWQTRRDTRAGELLVGHRHIAHIVPSALADRARAAAALTLTFASAAMEAQMAPVLPRRVAVLEAEAGTVFVQAKTPDQMLLADLLAIGPVEPRHAAWMTTRLLNLACWLEWAGLQHGAIGPDCLLVSPQHHSIALTDPFLCATRFGARLDILPERTLAALPRLLDPHAVAEASTDLELIRLTVREVLGDPAGTRLVADPDFPKPFATWLLMPAGDGAQADFAAWEQARDASFGPRRFIHWDLDPAALRAA